MVGAALFMNGAHSCVVQAETLKLCSLFMVKTIPTIFEVLFMDKTIPTIVESLVYG